MTLFTTTEVLALLRSFVCRLNQASATSTFIHCDQCARTTRGQPGLSLFICWYTVCCEQQGQPDNLLGESVILYWNSSL